MSFDGDLYPTSGASAVMTTKGDIVRYDSQRERYGIGSTNQVLSVTAGLPAWKTLTLADSVLTTAGDVLYENNTPELARLAKGSDGDVLTLASGLPSWAAPAGGASVELISDTQVTSDVASLSHTWSAVSFDDYSMVKVVFNGWLSASADMYITLQNPALTGTNYEQQRFEVKGGTAAGSEITEARIRPPNGNAKNWAGWIDIFADDTDNDHNDQTIKWILNCWSYGTSKGLQLDFGHYGGSTTETDSTGIHYASAGSTKFKDGFYSTAYKYSRT